MGESVGLGVGLGVDTMSIKQIKQTRIEHNIQEDAYSNKRELNITFRKMHIQTNAN